MRVVPQSFEIIQAPLNSEAERLTELIGRKCYQSGGRIAKGTAEPFVRMIRSRGHFAIFDHVSASVSWIVNIGIGRELTRHRIAGYAQESTRYCSYDKRSFGNELTFVAPHGRSAEGYRRWERAMADIERAYLDDIAAGMPAELARDMLPLATKSELVSTFDFTAWRNVFAKRTDKSAHPQMREIMQKALHEFQNRWPAFFDDL